MTLDTTKPNDASEMVGRDNAPRRRGCFAKAVLSLLGLLSAGFVAIAALLYFNGFFDNEIDDPNLRAPDIVAAVGDPALERRGSVTDLFLDHPIETAEHPLDPAVLVAEAGLKYLQENLRGYSARLVKNEQVGGKLQGEQFADVKIRQAYDGKPFAAYVKMLAPRKVAGAEAIWVDGENNDKIIAHGGGFLNLARLHLKTDGPVAMAGNRYPITEIGIETLLKRMLEKAKAGRKLDGIEVTVDRNRQIDTHPLTVITIVDAVERKGLDFHKAEVFIDDKLNLPIGYVGYAWPDEPGGELPIIESYFYQDLKVNPGLTDVDFDPDNEAYDYR